MADALDLLTQLLGNAQPGQPSPGQQAPDLSPEALRQLMAQEEPGPPNILDYLQGMLGRGQRAGEAAINYWKLRGLPDAVKSSILTQPSYAEGNRLPPAPASVAGRDAIASEYERSPGVDYRNSQLMSELSMRRYLNESGVRSDSINPFASTWSPESPYPAPLPPAGQRFPFGMY